MTFLITCLHLLRLRVRKGSLLSRFRHTFDAGMTTAEYAVGTVAAVGFAVVLFKVVRSAAVSSALSSIVVSALHAI